MYLECERQGSVSASKARFQSIRTGMITSGARCNGSQSKMHHTDIANEFLLNMHEPLSTVALRIKQEQYKSESQFAEFEHRFFFCPLFFFFFSVRATWRATFLLWGFFPARIHHAETSRSLSDNLQIPSALHHPVVKSNTSPLSWI